MELDLGGLVSLLFTIAILVVVVVWSKDKRPKDIKPFFRKLDSYTAFTWTILIVAGIIGLWLSVRVVGLYAKNYLFEENYIYIPYEILTIVAYALATNLCFNFAETLTLKSEERPRRIIGVAIQAVLVAVIKFLNVYRDQRDTSLFRFIGAFGFATMLIGMVITVLLLLFARLKLIKEGTRT